ncbi:MULTISPECIES: GxxExxY protein [unclassified Sphingopyxis]|uniref:GxxExxY protein n=1 Tax=unclassified Sphingopyxis TaxID=2614943 RepID=UPI00073794E0|nr:MULTISPECIES: GxxExxY protein [unclassified Sphingopyxis]KTE38217.1 Fe3+ hydroxamate ABC transporter substrate-binding protein [Sphingopyxis sp. HIX]KTE83786.1 Fe3+ hydroxamate ABC transporter substrate-binding protein [Sphingopyxis sp. HXXIV]
MAGKIEALANVAVDCGFHIHKDIGPGLLESAYEMLLFESLAKRGLLVERQVPVSLKANGIVIDNAFRADLFVERTLLIEVKSTEAHASVHAKQLLTYLRLMDLPLGLLMNFGAGTFKEGVRRIVNNHV